MIIDVNELDPMNRPFPRSEFHAVLRTRNARSALSLDDVDFGILMGLPERSKDLLHMSQCSQNVDVIGPHHGPYQLVASSSLHCHRLVE